MLKLQRKSNIIRLFFKIDNIIVLDVLQTVHIFFFSLYGFRYNESNIFVKIVLDVIIFIIFQSDSFISSSVSPRSHYCVIYFTGVLFNSFVKTVTNIQNNVMVSSNSKEHVKFFTLLII